MNEAMPHAQPRLIDGSMFGAPVDGEELLDTHTFVRAGISIASLPPGDVELRMQSKKDCIEVHVDGPPIRFGMNSDRIQCLEPTPKSVCFMPAGTDLRLQGGNYEPNLVLYFDPVRVAEQTDGNDRLNIGGKRVLAWAPNAEIGALGKLATDHLRSGEPINRLYIESIGTAILSLTLPMSAGVAAPRLRSLGMDHRVARARDFIEAHLGDRIELAEIAAAACLSPYHFLRTFKAATGETPHGYVMRRRLEEAQRLLVTGELPIVQIALATGFSSQAHLTTALRAATGATPAAVRQRGQTTAKRRPS